jgi:hypothetical protein
MFFKAFTIHSVFTDLILDFASGNAESPGRLALIAVSIPKGFFYDVPLKSRQDLVKVLVQVVHHKTPSVK